MFHRLPFHRGMLLLAALCGASLSAAAHADDRAAAAPQASRVAELRPANYSIDLSRSPSREFKIDTLDAAFVKIHFDYFNLPRGMSVEVSDPRRREVYRYGNRQRDGFTVDEALGQNGTTSFSAMSISGPAARVRLVGVAQEPWTSAHAVRVTRMLEGYPEDMLESLQQENLLGDVGTRSICGVNDKRAVACYAGTDTTAVDRSRPVARLLLARGSNCTAWRVGPGNHMFTNQHCIRTAAEAASAEVWFNYQAPACGGTTSGTVVKVTGASLLKNNGSLDYALFTVNNFASISSFGYLGLEVRAPTTGEEIFIPQHPGGRLKELAVVSNGARCKITVGTQNNLWARPVDTGYDCDTEGGSSGSPVVVRSSNRAIALHHLGTSCSNAGVQVAAVWPEVATFFGNVVPGGDTGGPPVNAPPIANFSFATSGLTATFTDSSSDSDGTIASRLWTFGDGSTSTLTNPSRTYAAAGTYSVSLKVTDNGGLSTTTTKSVVVSSTANTPPVANFSFTTSGLVATFTDSSTDAGGSIVSRSWNFGDGTTSTLTSPSKTYAAAGTYSVALTVTDNGGLTHTVTKSVTVSATTGGTFFQNLTDFAINDNSTVESPITVTGIAGNAPATLSVAVRIIHTFPSDVRVDLVAPDGSLYNIHNRTGGITNIIKTVTVNASTEVANGVWKLRVNDNVGGDTGIIDSWSMQF